MKKRLNTEEDMEQSSTVGGFVHQGYNHGYSLMGI